ncbi:hypothetical protein MVEN_02187600 [Mycena venus]|uniref:Uncharacterized protein n=1 Tax=Mycena venus TaxID=2733690 RepID=A0A8H6X887_9AGAR|nr:hypothetical protein MVEN_02187600 [Mycena venus]
MDSLPNFHYTMPEVYTALMDSCSAFIAAFILLMEAYDLLQACGKAQQHIQYWKQSYFVDWLQFWEDSDVWVEHNLDQHKPYVMDFLNGKGVFDQEVLEVETD